jgi:hypothetical protein
MADVKKRLDQETSRPNEGNLLEPLLLSVENFAPRPGRLECLWCS